MAETETIEPALETTPTPADTSWQQAIPAEYAKDKAWEPLKAKGLPDVLKGYAEAQKLVSSSIRLPGKDAKPEDVAKVKATLAAHGLLNGTAPATPAEYKFERPAAAEQLGWDTDAEAHMRAVWHKAGMTNEQVNAVVAGYAAWQEQRLGKAGEFVAKTEAELKSEWGAAYDAKLGATVRFVKATGAKYGIPELMTTTGLGNHANVIRWVADLAASTGEHSAMETTGGTTGTPGDYERQHAEILAEMSKTNPGSPRAQQLQASLEALLQKQYPS